MLKVTHGTQEKLTFNPMDMVYIVDLRSLGYYKVTQGVLQQNLSEQYHFESANTVYNQFNRLINMLKKEEKEKGNDKYPWLDDSDERKYMTDREILGKYINLDNSALTRREKNEVTQLCYEYKDTFSLRDEIGACPNFEVEIDVTDKTPFFIRPFYVEEEDKAILHKEMKRLCYLEILKEGISAYSSPVMLICRKVTQDKKDCNRLQAFKYADSQK